MVNQSFTTDNFRKIIDFENRRGVYLENKFFPEIANVTKEIKECMAGFRELKRAKPTLSQEEYRERQSQLNQRKIELTQKKADLVTEELEQVRSKIAAGSFQIALRKVALHDSKDAYAADNTPAAYFAIKQVQFNIRELYKVKQSSRYEIICQLKGVLEDGFPKYVIRTDIKDFYESIPHDKLLKKLDEEALLTLPSRRIIGQILRDFRNLAGTTKGIPRGIGISAYLSELYMREFDSAIRAIEDVIFYARYVDDVIVIFAPGPNSSVDRFMPLAMQHAANLGLTLNLDPDKTSEHDLRKPQKCVLNYLGYKITFGVGSVRIALSDNRKRKYKERLKRSFDSYKHRAQFDEKRARRLLVKRIQFLTGNTRLHNSKNNVMVGVFYSNSHLSGAGELDTLDQSLNAQVNSLPNEALKTRLKKYSFQEGFSQRRFQAFNAWELSQIVGIWKHEA
jgi:hypothetical protein